MDRRAGPTAPLYALPHLANQVPAAAGAVDSPGEGHASLRGRVLHQILFILFLIGAVVAFVMSVARRA